nr:hypothetical protein [uncultured bacterium]
MPLTVLVMLLFRPAAMLAPPWLLVLTLLWSAASIVLLSVMLHGPALRIVRHRASYLPGEREPQATAAVPAL